MQPDVKTVAVTRTDGGISVVRIIENEYREPNRKEIEEGKTGPQINKHYEITPEYVEEIIAKYNWTGDLTPVNWRIVENDYVDETTDRTYRNAWKDVPGRNKPDHDMVKARNIHRDHLRKTRIPLLDTLDIEYVRADELNDRQMKTTIATQKQKLRDVTADPRIEAAQTIEELKLLTIEELTK